MTAFARTVGEIVSFRAHVSLGKTPSALMRVADLQSAGLSVFLRDICGENEGATPAGCALVADLMEFAFVHPAPASIVVVSRPSTPLEYALSLLRRRSYNVHLLVPKALANPTALEGEFWDEISADGIPAIEHQPVEPAEAPDSPKVPTFTSYANDFEVTRGSEEEAPPLATYDEGQEDIFDTELYEAKSEYLSSAASCCDKPDMDDRMMEEECKEEKEACKEEEEYRKEEEEDCESKAEDQDECYKDEEKKDWEEDDGEEPKEEAVKEEEDKDEEYARSPSRSWFHEKRDPDWDPSRPVTPKTPTLSSPFPIGRISRYSDEIPKSTWSLKCQGYSPTEASLSSLASSVVDVGSSADTADVVTGMQRSLDFLVCVLSAAAVVGRPVLTWTLAAATLKRVDGQIYRKAGLKRFKDLALEAERRGLVCLESDGPGRETIWAGNGLSLPV